MNDPSCASFPVRCPQCHSQIVAAPDQIGTLITCDDCLEEFLVKRAEPGHILEDSEPHDGGLSPISTDRPDDQQRIASDTEWLHLDEDLTVADPFEESSPVDPPLEDYEFTITCPLCATRQSVTHLQVGQEIKCPDCFSSFPIPTPPRHQRRERKSPQVDVDPEDFALSEPVELPRYKPLVTEELDSAPTQDGVSGPRAKKSVSPDQSPVLDALRKAEEEVANEERLTARLPANPLTVGNLGFLVDIQTIARGVVLGIGLQIEAGAISSAMALLGSGNAMAMFRCALLFAFFFAFGLVWYVACAVTMLAIVQETAAGRDGVESWPEFDIGGWLYDSLHIASALLVAVLPGFLLGHGFILLGWLTHDWSLPAACLTSVLLLFPVLLIANLETGSVVNIISGPVFRSLFNATRHWLWFLLITLVLTAGGTVAWQLRRFETFVPNFLAAVAMMAITMIYFRILGRLTWVCQEASQS